MRKAVAGLIILTGLIMLGAPGVADAATYVWKDVDGRWNDHNNWTQIDGLPGAGYPNNAGDIAAFTNAIYATHRTVIVPNTEMTVGIIRVNRVWITIAPDGPHSRLVFDNGRFDALIDKYDGQSTIDSLEINVPIRLRGSDLVISASKPTGVKVGFIGQTGGGGSRSVIKRGEGRVVFSTPATGYTGLTTVEEGELQLAAGFGNAIVGDLTIGDGIGPRNSARVTTFGGDQIEDHATVRVRSDGRYEPSGSDRIGRLIVSGSILARFGPLMPDAMTLEGGAAVEIDDELVLASDLVVTANAAGPATIVQRPTGKGINLGGATRTIIVEDGPSPIDFEISASIKGTGAAGLIKDGTGTMRLGGTTPNTYPGTTRVQRGRLEITRARNSTKIPGRLEIGVGAGPATAFFPNDPSPNSNTLATITDIVVGPGGTMTAHAPEALHGLSVAAGGRVVLADAAAIWTLQALAMAGGTLTLNQGTLQLAGDAVVTSSAIESAAIAGGAGAGGFFFVGPGRSLVVADGPQAIDLRMTARTATEGLAKRGPGTMTYESPGGGALAIDEGTMIVSGTCQSCAFKLTGGVLGGSGTIGGVTATGGAIAPGTSPGRLVTHGLSLTSGSSLSVEVNGTSAGTTHDQVEVRGQVTLGGATLLLPGGAAALPKTGASLTIIANDGTDPVNGTFAGLAEGAAIRLGTRELTISYAGGDGNDVVLSAGDTTPYTYFLAEGATGAFFDDDVLIANPNDVEAPVTLTFLQEGGATVVEHRTLPAQSRLTVHVDQIAGLESAAASVQVVSDDRRPLVVERTMFWDASYYGGHTANAVAQPETTWVFAEGSQGFFDTYILIANANAASTTATLTFLREGETPLVTTVTLDAFARKTVYAGDYPELTGRSFGIVVDAAAPVIAERSMYFVSQPGRLWTGGHVNTGTVAPSTSWFHAEGATGGFFNTFILLSNPQDMPANVELRFLLDSGEVITRTKTIDARQRLTINPADENDERLENAALSTVVISDVPIVSERSMYWGAGEALPFGEGHNSSGIVEAATRWGLAEGRVGGAHEFATFILLANPSAQAAQVTITFLPEQGTPIVKTYEVPATSRFNVDVKSSVPELRDASFGARIEATNGVPIAVERSLYWNANGVFWAGGTNALATRLQ